MGELFFFEAFCCSELYMEEESLAVPIFSSRRAMSGFAVLLFWPSL